MHCKQAFVLRYSELIEKLPTRAFLVPLKEDEEVEIELSKVRARVVVCVLQVVCVLSRAARGVLGQRHQA
jgi:hypothetical protein